MKDIDGYVTKDNLYRVISRIKYKPDIVVDNTTCNIIIEAIYAMPKADVQPVKWISVKDRLPDDCVEVLVYDTDCGIVIGWYNKKDDIFVAEFMNELDAVTHWMPLPEPPKDGDTNE